MESSLFNTDLKVMHTAEFFDDLHLFYYNNLLVYFPYFHILYINIVF